VDGITGGQVISCGLGTQRTWRAVTAFRSISRPAGLLFLLFHHRQADEEAKKKKKRGEEDKERRPAIKCAVTDGKAQRFMGHVVIGCCVRWHSHGRI